MSRHLGWSPPIQGFSGLFCYSWWWFPSERWIDRAVRSCSDKSGFSKERSRGRTRKRFFAFIYSCDMGPDSCCNEKPNNFAWWTEVGQQSGSDGGKDTQDVLAGCREKEGKPARLIYFQSLATRFYEGLLLCMVVLKFAGKPLGSYCCRVIASD